MPSKTDGSIRTTGEANNRTSPWTMSVSRDSSVRTQLPDLPVEKFSQVFFATDEDSRPENIVLERSTPRFQC